MFPYLLTLSVLNTGGFLLVARTRRVTVPRFFLCLTALAIAIMGVLFWLDITDSQSWRLGVPFVFLLLSFAPGVAIYGFSRLPFKVRLTFEILALIALLALSSWIWRDGFCSRQADRALHLTRQISAWADQSGTPGAREKLRREAEWFRRRELGLRREAYWIGLIKGPSNDSYVPYTTDSLIRELGILEVMDKHENVARRIHEGLLDEQVEP